MDMCPKLLLKSNQKLELNCHFFLDIGLELRTDIKWPQIYIMHENNMYKTGNYKNELTKSNVNNSSIKYHILIDSTLKFDSI
jgi:hypothetical protein